MKKIGLLFLALGVISGTYAASTQFGDPASDDPLFEDMIGTTKAHAAEIGHTAMELRNEAIRFADDTLEAGSQTLGMVKEGVTAASQHTRETLDQAGKRADQMREQLHEGLAQVQHVRAKAQEALKPFKLDKVDRGMLYGAAGAIGGTLMYHAWREYRAVKKKYPDISDRAMFRRLVRGGLRRAMRAVGGKEGAVAQLVSIAIPLWLLATTGQYVYKHREAIGKHIGNYWHGAQRSEQRTPTSHTVTEQEVHAANLIPAALQEAPVYDESLHGVKVPEGMTFGPEPHPELVH